jgi:hypothetical protein
MSRILRHAFLHALQLFGRGIALKFSFPFRRWHSVDDFARLILGERSICLHHPIGKAVAAKSGKAHQVDIFGIVAVLKMRDQTAESGGGGLVGNLFVILHSYAPFR